MDILRTLGGYTPQLSDLARGRMSEKFVSETKNIRAYFIWGTPDERIPGCVSKGISEERAKQIFSMILDASEYAFNKSHAAACALMVYRMAWLKKYYEQEFAEAVEKNKGKE